MTRVGTPCFRATPKTVSGIDVDTITRPCASPNSRARAGRLLPVRQINRRAKLCSAIHDAALGERDGEAAVGTVMRRTNDSGLDRLEQRVDQSAFALEIARRRRSRNNTVDTRQILAAAELGRRRAEQDDRVAFGLELGPRDVRE